MSNLLCRLIGAAVAFLDRHEGAITALATIVIAFFTWALARSTKRLWKEAETASGIANKTAEVALKNTQHMMAAERAYVKMAHVPPGLTLKKEGDISKVLVQVKIRNFGRTPATVTDALLNIKRLSRSERLPATPPYEIQWYHGAIRAFLVADEEVVKTDGHGWVEIPSLDSIGISLADLQSGAAQLFVFGYVDYIDQFGQRHRAGYAMRYEPDFDDRARYGTDEAFDKRDNLVFVAQDGYNYDRPRKPGEGHDWGEEPN